MQPYIIGSGSALGEVVRYVSHTQHGTTTGNIKAMSLWLGQGVGLVDSIQCAAEIVRKIRDEADTVLRRIDASHTVQYCLPLADSDCRHLTLECRLSASYSGIADEAEENAKARVLSYYDIEEKFEQILTQLSARPWDEETVVETGGELLLLLAVCISQMKAPKSASYSKKVSTWQSWKKHLPP